MGQYEIAKFLYDNGESTRKEIERGVRLSSTSVSESLTSLKQKELVEETDKGFIFHREATESDLESIKPTRLSDALDSDS